MIDHHQAHPSFPLDSNQLKTQQSIQDEVAVLNRLEQILPKLQHLNTAMTSVVETMEPTIKADGNLYGFQLQDDDKP